MTVGRLIAPESDDEILDLELEALALKPVMTGDVFVGVRVPGEPEPLDVMVVVTHAPSGGEWCLCSGSRA